MTHRLPSHASLAPAAILATVWLAIARAETPPAPMLPPAQQSHLITALDTLNMSLRDLESDRDAARPRYVLASTREVLLRPLHLFAMADDIRACAPHGLDGFARLSARLFDPVVSNLPAASQVATPDVAPWLTARPGTGAANVSDLADPALRAAVSNLCSELPPIVNRVSAALSGIPRAEAEAAAAACFAETFALEDAPGLRPVLLAAGLSTGALERALADGMAVDPEPASLRYLATVSRVDVRALAEALRLLADLASRCTTALQAATRWPDQPLRIATPAGDVCVGTPDADRWDAPAAAILDPAGDDTYGGEAGSANGLLGTPLAMLIDLGGNDVYRGSGLLAAGSALFGVCLLVDVDGDDMHRADFAGQAAACFGGRGLLDQAGRDSYDAHGFAQGAAAAGFAVLDDARGNDVYNAGFCAQAYAGTAGLGFLLDRAGNDRYLAGTRRPDFERHENRYLSMAQGFAIGMRPFAGGGVAALVDLAGNDGYEADVYGQGSAYWYAAGFLIDESGNDTYRILHYGQGAGIHLSCGLLFDGDGHDQYTGFILSQGCAHDFAVGVLVDHAGNDTYSADHHSQGRAINNSLAMLLDAGGDDAYFARQPAMCQGIGDDGGNRESGSLALLLDLGGRDRYSCGVTDGRRRLRPSFGIVYDAGEAAP